MKLSERDSNARMLTLDQAAGYAGMGRSSFKTWAAKIGAVRRFSERMIRYDRTIIDAALDSMKEEGAD